MKLSPKVTAMLSSYGRSFLAAAVALWTTGNTDPKALLAAGLAAVIPVALRALNPKDPAFGIVTAAMPSVLKFLSDTQKKSKK
jgi:phage tail sheath gpL-like